MTERETLMRWLRGGVAHTLDAHITRGARLCVGLSGGVDSVVLLDVLHALAPSHGWQLSAIHVNHQLSPYAAEWARFCRQRCRALGVPLRVVKVTVARGDSIEAAARAARYAAYRAQPAENVVLAQHQDDQAETVLLQLLRGAGVKGLAAMPVVRDDHARRGLRLLRPLLEFKRDDIAQYAAARDLSWVEDESNFDAYYLRNYLRIEIMPRLEARVPDYRNALARAAGHMAEASQLLDFIAEKDSEDQCVNGTLAVERVRTLHRLSAARARNLLRHFLATHHVRLPDARRLDEALRQVTTAKSDARVCIALGTHTLRRFGGALHLVPAQIAPPAPAKTWTRQWCEERQLAVPELAATLLMRRRRATRQSAAIDLAKLLAKPVTLRLRQGGEKLQPDAARPRRYVKTLFQERSVPPWQRERVPYLWSGEHLVWVAGLGIDCAFQARAGVACVTPQWVARAVRAPA